MLINCDCESNAENTDSSWEKIFLVKNFFSGWRQSVPRNLLKQLRYWDFTPLECWI